MMMSGAKERPGELQSRYETELQMTQLAAQGDQAAKRSFAV